MRTQKVVLGARATWFSGDTQDLPREVADAVALLDEEVEEILFTANAERQVQRVKQQRGW